jgi:hypothetical protein
VIELTVSAGAFVALGALRPRWTTLSAAFLPAAVAFVWLLLHEDIPGERLGFVDYAWYAGMSLLVGGVYAVAAAVGVVSGRALRRLSRALSRSGNSRAWLG